jgi:hypothetical protein
MRKLLPILALFILSGFAYGSACNLASGSGIACVQMNVVAGASPGNLAFGSSNTAGNEIIAIVRCTGGNTATPTDTRNTYSTAIANQQIGPGTSRISIYYAENIGAGANTVASVCTTGSLKLAIFEFSGLRTTGSLDKTHGAAGTGTAVASGATTTTAQSVELAIGGNSWGNVTDTPGAGSGWTLEETAQASSNSMEIEDQILTSTGTPNATFAAVTNAAGWGAEIATFEANTSGGVVRHRAQVINQ